MHLYLGGMGQTQTLVLHDAEIVGRNLHIRFHVVDDAGVRTAVVVLAGSGVVVDIQNGAPEIDEQLIERAQLVLTAKSVLDVVGAWDRRNRRRVTR